MIRILKTGVALLLAVSLGACGSMHSASRAAMPDDTMLGMSALDVSIDSYTVSVPRSLRVNEANLYYPLGDIVWRGDPPGDRYLQVAAMFETALNGAAPVVQGARPVRVDVMVTRFHGLSEKARYHVGGVHSIAFKYRLVDVASGLQIGATKELKAPLQALYGDAAIAADARGETQKHRVIAHLTDVFASELTLPGGYASTR